MSASRRQGQHAGLTTRDIVQTAVHLADQNGLPALSMRKLATELEVEAMALYHHFPSKEALFDAMVEELATAAPLPHLDGTDWRDGLRRYTRAQLDTLAAHPALIPLVLTRPATTAGNLALMESLLQSLHAAGFQPQQSLDLIHTLNELVLAHAALGAGVGGAPPPHGEPGQAGRLADLPTQTYPLLTQAAHANTTRGPNARFEFAIDALINGFADSLGKP